MLTGLRVIEIGQAFSAPFGAEILGFLGAEVIKIERPGGDDTRSWGQEFKDGASITFHVVNRNKKSVVLDLKDPRDKAALEELIGSADAFIHNMRPGAAERLGLGSETLRSKFPRLIYAEIGAFGHKGPMKSEAGYEILMQAFSGIMSITGDPDGMPVRSGPSICDFGSGMWLALGVLAALNQRQQTGQGCVINTSIFETGLNWALVASGGYLAQGQPPQRIGNGHPDLVPYGLFPSKDGALIIGAGNNRLFEKLIKVLGCESMMDDPRFQTNSTRIKHRQEVQEIISAALHKDTTDNWLIRLKEAGVPCSPVQSVPQALDHPQTQALDILQSTADSPDLRFIGLPLSFDGKRPDLRSTIPAAGASNDEILKKQN
ncbi:CaiB/BaiF CoA transferase family protein [Rhodovibrionaceae bacterium A322]